MITHIELRTTIDAPLYRCFDLSRSIDLHQVSTKETNERAVAGRTTGLIRQGETVTWEAKHFGIRQRLGVKIVRMNYPFYFKDVMIKGAFKSMEHEHRFSVRDGKTVMIDLFSYELPFGIIGLLFDRIMLKKHMLALLILRNKVIKNAAESNGWRDFVAA